jgi:TPR repeat protein
MRTALTRDQGIPTQSRMPREPADPPSRTQPPQRLWAAEGFPRSLIALLAFALLAGCNEDAAPPAANGTAESAVSRALAERCDQLAADPEDPKRLAPGIAEPALAVPEAIEACANATLAQPANQRLHYQHGRALRAGGRQAEAFTAFKRAADLGYAPGMKAVGDAYLTGQGLPPGESQSTETALAWYERAIATGEYPPAAAAARQARGAAPPPPNPQPAPTNPTPPAPNPQPVPTPPDPQSAIDKCDELASDPFDPGRMKKGVPDGDIALGEAIAACTEAARLAPNIARLHYQAGRVLQLANRRDEAFGAFLEAADLGYAPAVKGVGDSYVDGKGLPPGEPQSIERAAELFEQSWHAGYAPAEDASREAREHLRQITFSSEGFQNKEYIERLYYGDFGNIDTDFAFAIYALRMFQELDSEQVVDHDPSCKPLLHREGQITIAASAISGFLVEVQRAASGSRPGEIIPRVGWAIFTYKQGEQDTYLIIKPKGWGCDSDVGRTILGNLGDLMRLLIRHFEVLSQ